MGGRKYDHNQTKNQGAAAFCGAAFTERFAELVASKNKGMIMKNVMPELKGKAEGAVINQVVAKICQ